MLGRRLCGLPAPRDTSRAAQDGPGACGPHCSIGSIASPVAPTVVRFRSPGAVEVLVMGSVRYRAGMDEVL